jgi:hypothetical protein
MHRGAKLIAVLGSASAVAACTAAPPSGPTVMALPSHGKSLGAFQQDDGQCHNYAAAAIGPHQPAQAGAGAAIGGAAGLVGGTAVGATNIAASQYDLQTRYNIAYTQCMYSRGDTVEYLPASSYGYYGYEDWGYPWYGWGGPWFVGDDVFAFDGDHGFHHGFHDHFHNGFHGGFLGGRGGHR